MRGELPGCPAAVLRRRARRAGCAVHAAPACPCPQPACAPQLPQPGEARAGAAAHRAAAPAHRGRPRARPHLTRPLQADRARVRGLGWATSLRCPSLLLRRRLHGFLAAADACMASSLHLLPSQGAAHGAPLLLFPLAHLPFSRLACCTAGSSTTEPWRCWPCPRVRACVGAPASVQHLGPNTSALQAAPAQWSTPASRPPSEERNFSALAPPPPPPPQACWRCWWATAA